MNSFEDLTDQLELISSIKHRNASMSHADSAVNGQNPMKTKLFLQRIDPKCENMRVHPVVRNFRLFSPDN